ncbi:ABC transporter permease [Lentilactobacillus kisonensis]|nr:ABC transporter permease [Lentilactobacillus kisonensis]
MRILTMIKRILTEMLRDKRTLALMFIAPLFILSLLYFLFQSNTDQTASLGVRNVNTTLVSAVKNKHVKIHEVTSNQSAEKVIHDHDYAGVLSQSGDHLALTLQNSDQSKTAILKQSLQKGQIQLKSQAAVTVIKTQAKALKKMQAALAAVTRQMGQAGRNGQVGRPSMDKSVKNAPNYQVTTHYLYGSSKSTYFNTLLPILIGFVVFFFVFLISGIALLRERTTGTLNRLLATPIKRGEVIMGYLSGYGIFALIQTLLVVLFTIYVFNIQILGSIWNIFLINILLAIVALTLGLLISTFASSEFQMVQFIPIVVIPQIFFSGIIPVNQMADWLQPVAKIMPLYYGAQSMSDVIQKGASIVAIAPSLGILLIFIVVFLALNMLSMRHYRQV